MKKKVGFVKGVIDFLTIRRRLPALYPAWASRLDLYRECNRVFLSDGTVRWVCAGEQLPFADHVELSGSTSSHVLSYMVDEAGFYTVHKHCVFPLLRLLPDATEASFSHNFDCEPKLIVGGAPHVGRARFIDLRGSLRIEEQPTPTHAVERVFYPAPLAAALIEQITLTNLSEDSLAVSVSMPPYLYTEPKSRCKAGPYEARAEQADSLGRMLTGLEVDACRTLSPQESTTYWVVYYATEADKEQMVDCKLEGKKRRALVEDCFGGGLRLESDVPLYDTLFAHARLRAHESIYDTPVGRMPCPGGGVFYGAVWCNDSVEYSAPYFALSGDPKGEEAQLNVLQMFGNLFAKRRGKWQPIPSSIASLGQRYWALAGDRGDVQMYGSACARYALLRGEESIARTLFPYVKASVEYTLQQRTVNGLIRSDSDELEGRFPSGRTNLSTASLAFDLFARAAELAYALGERTLSSQWKQEATLTAQAIETHLGDKVEGYCTYRYYPGNRRLRSWICMPLTVGIYDRAGETARALSSPSLYDGVSHLRTASNRTTTWDRSMLFALRGLFQSGQSKVATEMLLRYSSDRLVGAHAPYPVEAFPEGNGRHLSAESILYCRIFIEGVFGLRTKGLSTVSVQMHPPVGCNRLTLHRVHVQGAVLTLRWTKGHLTVTDLWDNELYSGPAPAGHTVYINTKKPS